MKKTAILLTLLVLQCLAGISQTTTNLDYFTDVTFPAGFVVGDYIEFVKVDPTMAGASGNYEISIAYTRSNIAAAATFLASVSHANPAVWRELGKINNNAYVGSAFNFTIDCNSEYSNARFRIRAINAYGVLTEALHVAIRVRSINYNGGWTPLNATGNDVSVTSFLPMTDEWNLYVGTPFSAAGASLAIRASGNGNVGIGTASPASKLDVNGDMQIRPAATAWGEGLTFTMPETQKWGGVRWRRDRANFDGNWAIGYTGLDGTDDLVFLANNNGTQINNILRLTKNGNIGIGTTNPGDYKLAVEGTLGARKVKITQASWADYVFDSSYQLASLPQVEKYIQENKHLPDVPTAVTVSKEGVDVGESQALLLRKIEELTLYIIQQHKQMQQMQDKMEKLEKQLNK